MTSPRIAVIGAGAAGLAALQVLGERGFAVEAFEKTDRIGGHWHTDYDSLHLITSRDVSGFAGFPMPADFPVYPSRNQMRAYLESYADKHDLRERISFNTEVTAVRPKGRAGAGGWTLETSDARSRDYDYVLVANGHLWDPRLPRYEGTYTGKQLHSSEYHNVHDVDGERVLVVGAGNSGCDLVVDAAMAGLDASISLRQGQMFQPKAIFGRPRAEIRWLGRLPLTLQERVTRALINVVVGPPTAYRGLAEPPTRNLNRQKPVVNNLLLYWIQHGRVTALPGIARFDGRTVHFTDGSQREFDTVIWATGFNVKLPFLDSSLLTWEQDVPLRVGGLTVPVGLERLFFVGLAAPRGPQLPVYSAQSELIGRFIDLLESQDVALSMHLAGRQKPDQRIDILRPIWLKQMTQTQREVERLGRSVPSRAGAAGTAPERASAAPLDT